MKAMERKSGEICASFVLTEAQMLSSSVGLRLLTRGPFYKELCP